MTFNVSGASLQSVVQRASQAIAAEVTLPSGVYTEFTGAAQAEQQTRNELVLYSATRAGPDPPDSIHRVSLAREQLAGAGEFALLA